MFLLKTGNTVRQVESCLSFGLQRKDDGLQLVPHRGEEHPVLPADEESSASSWPGNARRRVHGDECRVLRFSPLCKEVQDQTGENTILPPTERTRYGLNCFFFIMLCLHWISEICIGVTLQQGGKILFILLISADHTNLGGPSQYFPAFPHGGQNAFYPSMAVLA